jgi:MoxR-like ATPase
MNDTLSPDPLKRTQGWYAAIRDQLSRAVMGQTTVLEQLLLTLLCGEHALMEGGVGTAKWTAVESLGRCFGLTSRRFRCSADVELSDLLDEGAWATIWNTGLLLVDGFDSLGGKVRNIVQQAMSERVMEAANQRIQVPDPFVVFASRYRAEEIPLPDRAEPYDDRFLFQINVPNPSYHEEYAVASVKSGLPHAMTETLLSKEDLFSWRATVREIVAPPSVVNYAVRLVRATRIHEGENPDFVYEWVHQGAGPRAAHFLVLSAKARATLYGRGTATHEDIRNLTLPVLRHRIITNRNARENGIDSDRVIRRLLEDIPPRVVGDDVPPTAGTSLTFHNWTAVEDDPE